MDSWYTCENSDEDDEIASNMAKVSTLAKREAHRERHEEIKEKIRQKNLQADPVNHYLQQTQNKASLQEQQRRENENLEERLAPKLYYSKSDERKTCPAHKASHFTNLICSMMSWPPPKVNIWAANQEKPNSPPFSVSIQACGYMFILHDMHFGGQQDLRYNANPTTVGWGKKQCQQIAYDSFIGLAIYPDEHTTDEDYSLDHINLEGQFFLKRFFEHFLIIFGLNQDLATRVV